MADKNTEQENNQDFQPSFQTPQSVQDAYEKAYYEAAGQELPDHLRDGAASASTPDQTPSFAEYVSTDAFWAGQQTGGASQAQPFVDNAYQQPWNSSPSQGGPYQQAGYQQTGYYQGGAGYQQQGYAPYAQPTSSYARSKDHVVAGLLAIFLGSLGIHKFYMGYNNAGFIMLGVSIIGSMFTFGLAGAAMQVVGLIEGIIYLTKNQQQFDAEYSLGRKEWF